MPNVHHLQPAARSDYVLVDSQVAFRGALNAITELQTKFASPMPPLPALQQRGGHLSEARHTVDQIDNYGVQQLKVFELRQLKSATGPNVHLFQPAARSDYLLIDGFVAFRDALNAITELQTSSPHLSLHFMLSRHARSSQLRKLTASGSL